MAVGLCQTVPQGADSQFQPVASRQSFKGRRRQPPELHSIQRGLEPLKGHEKGVRGMAGVIACGDSERPLIIINDVCSERSPREGRLEGQEGAKATTDTGASEWSRTARMRPAFR